MHEFGSYFCFDYKEVSVHKSLVPMTEMAVTYIGQKLYS